MKAGHEIGRRKSPSYLRGITRLGIALLSLGIMLLLAFLGADNISEYAQGGILLSVRCVIPAVFPFLILSDMYVTWGMPEKIKPLSAFFCRIFNLPEIALRPIVCGWLCGFPVGMKISAELYRGGALSREQAERLCAVTNTPSPAFLISAVGVGMWGSRRIGIALLVCSLLSSVLTGVVFRGRLFIRNTEFSFGQRFDFVESVKSAGANSVTVASFIIIFSVITGMLADIALPTLLLGSVSSLLELTNACRFFSEAEGIHKAIAFSMTGFSLGFGGLSVAMQSCIFTRNTDLRISRYLAYKLLVGVLTALLSLCAFYILFP